MIVDQKELAKMLKTPSITPFSVPYVVSARATGVVFVQFLHSMAKLSKLPFLMTAHELVHLVSEPFHLLLDARTNADFYSRLSSRSP